MVCVPSNSSGCAGGCEDFFFIAALNRCLRLSSSSSLARRRASLKSSCCCFLFSLRTKSRFCFRSWTPCSFVLRLASAWSLAYSCDSLPSSLSVSFNLVRNVRAFDDAAYSPECAWYASASCWRWSPIVASLLLTCCSKYCTNSTIFSLVLAPSSLDRICRSASSCCASSVFKAVQSCWCWCCCWCCCCCLVFFSSR